MDHHQIALFHPRQPPIHRKLIVIFAQAARYIVQRIRRCIPFAADMDMMISAVHGRPHQIGCTGIHPQIPLMDILFVDGPCDQPTLRPGHKSAQLRLDLYPGLGGITEHPDIFLPDPFTDPGDIRLLLIGMIGDAHAAGKIDEIQGHAAFLFQSGAQIKQNAGKRWIIAVPGGIAGQEGMQAEFLCPHFFQLIQAQGQLFPGPAIFGIPGGAHDGRAHQKFTAGIIPDTDHFRNAPIFRQHINIADIIQIDDGIHCPGMGKFLRRHGIGAEHYIIPLHAQHFRQQQFTFDGAIQAAALLLKNLQDAGIGQRLHRKIFFKIRRPGKSGI